jgi:hypothetical protein
MISQNNQSAQAIKVGCSSNEWSKCGENFLMVDFENTITASIFVGISIMTTFWKSHGHSASNGIDLVEIWALCQKITAPEARSPSKYAMKP